jgi:hypothetical protein
MEEYKNGMKELKDSINLDLLRIILSNLSACAQGCLWRIDYLLK